MAAAGEGRDHESDRLPLADDDGLDVREEALGDRGSRLERACRRGHLARPARAHLAPSTRAIIEAS